MRPAQSSRNFWLLNLAIGLLYFGLARSGLMLASLQANASPVWPATGFAIAMLYLFGGRYVFGIAIGAFIANNMIGTPSSVTLFITVGNSAEALIGAWILHRFLKHKDRFAYQSEVIAVTSASAVAGLASASIGSLALHSNHVINGDLAKQVWLTWWMGDLIGGLIFIPVLLGLDKISLKVENPAHVFGAFAATVAVTYFTFYMPAGSSYLFLIFPVILYASYSLNETYTLAISFLICAVSIAATVNSHGPFSSGNLNDRLMDLQIFLAALSLTTLTFRGFQRAYLIKMPIFVPLACWAVTGALFYSFDHSEKAAQQIELQNLAQDIEDAVNARIDAYRDALHGGAGLYRASQSVEPDEWRNYNESVRVVEKYPGIMGLGIIWRVKTKDFAAFEGQVRRSGLKDFKIKTMPDMMNGLNPDDDHYVIKYIEPLEPNKEFIGRDAGAEFERRAAADQTRDSGEAAVTAKLTIRHADTSFAGFWILYPIYRNKAKIGTVEERRKALLGWVYGPVSLERYFVGILKENGKTLDMHVYEGERSDADKLVFKSESGDHFHADFAKTIHIGPQTYHFEWQRRTNIVQPHNSALAITGFCGALFSLLLTSLIVNLKVLGQRARALADEATAEIQKSRELLKQSERRLTFALEGSSDGIWDWDLVKGEMYVSEKLADFFGGPQIIKLDSPDKMGRTIHPDDIAATLKSLTDHLEGRTPVHEAEARLRSANGEWKWMLTRGKISELTLKGRPARMTGVHIDIERLKKVEDALEVSKQHLTNVANSTPSIISQWSRDMRLIFANRYFYEWFGGGPTDYVGKTMEQIISPEVFASRKPMIEKALDGIAQNFEGETARSLTGERRYIISTYLPDRINDKIEGFFVFGQDVTELKKAQISAMEGQRLAMESTRVKSAFLANMSHEIRTPINCIVGMAGLMMDTSLEPTQREYMENLKSNVDALLGLINDILDFSKIEAGKLEIETTEFDLRDLLTNLIKSMQYAAQQKSLSIELSGLEQIKTLLCSDPGRIRQILANFISNAIKFTPQGKIAVRAQSVRSSAEQTRFRFEVEDNGIGISEDQLSKLFQAFTQADASTTRRFGGTGLGLSISKQLAELLGGEIGVQSKVGAGSTFWFELDLQHGQDFASKKEKSISPMDARKWSGTRVLVAEDNYFNQIVLTKQLQKLNIRADIVATGQEAINALKVLPYDLVLMDCNMPEMDGFEATRLIRQSKTANLAAIPIIAITANAIDEARESCFEAGMNDFVTKPIAEADLHQVLLRWLAPKETESALIDTNVLLKLEDLQTPDEPDLIVDLIDTYFKKVETLTKLVEKSDAAKDGKVIASEMHQLKSASRTIGALLIGDLCEKIEKAIQSGRTKDVYEIWTQLKERLLQAREELTEIKKSRLGKVA